MESLEIRTNSTYIIWACYIACLFFHHKAIYKYIGLDDGIYGSLQRQHVHKEFLVSLQTSIKWSCPCHGFGHSVDIQVCTLLYQTREDNYLDFSIIVF